MRSIQNDRAKSVPTEVMTAVSLGSEGEDSHRNPRREVHAGPCVKCFMQFLALWFAVMKMIVGHECWLSWLLKMSSPRCSLTKILHIQYTYFPCT